MPYPPEGYKITTDVPVMAPHDFSEDLGGYVDIWPLNITANVPVVNGVASRKPHGSAGIWAAFSKDLLPDLNFLENEERVGKWLEGFGKVQSENRAGRRV